MEAIAKKRAKLFEATLAILDGLELENGDRIDEAGVQIGSRLARGGRFLLFGCGHSGLAVQDVYYRAGGLKDARVIFVDELMLDRVPVEDTSRDEKRAGWIEERLLPLEIAERDALLVVSTSGVNAVPVEVAAHARARGAWVGAITSRAWAAAAAPRHPSGLRLADHAHLVLDNGVPPGDALVALPADRRAGSASTIASALLLQALTVAIAAASDAAGLRLPLWVSGNAVAEGEAGRR